MSHRFDPTVLREYDIRGIVGKTLKPQDAYAVGRSFGTVVRQSGGRTVCLGFDGRASSPELAGEIARGLTECGLDVWRVGLGPTPMLYFSTVTLKADAGLMVTGSHNPAEYNGFKMMKGGKAFFGEEIKKLGELAAVGRYESAATPGTITDRPMLEAYVDRLLSDYDGKRGLRVAWDAGNGAAGPAMAKLTAKLPGEHFLLYEDVDARFPNHHPDPTVEKNLKDLQKLVLDKECDLGIAFDGDGDRIGVVDGQARVLWGDQLIAILARDVLKSRPGATVIADVKASQVLFDEIARAGGKPLMYKTGHSLIKSKMAEVQAPLAGEMSGHIFFADRYYGFDDALYAAVRLLGIVARSDQSLAQMRDAFPAVVNTPELRFPCPEERKFAVVDEVRERLSRTDFKVTDIDGVRVQTRDGWWLLRASNTQDVLVARCEAKDQAGLERLQAQLVEQLKQSGIQPPQF